MATTKMCKFFSSNNDQLQIKKDQILVFFYQSYCINLATITKTQYKYKLDIPKTKKNHIFPHPILFSYKNKIKYDDRKKKKTELRLNPTFDLPRTAGSGEEIEGDGKNPSERRAVIKNEWTIPIESWSLVWWLVDVGSSHVLYHYLRFWVGNYISTSLLC